MHISFENAVTANILGGGRGFVKTRPMKSERRSPAQCFGSFPPSIESEPAFRFPLSMFWGSKGIRRSSTRTVA
jgi:hypothetical protein